MQHSRSPLRSAVSAGLILVSACLASVAGAAAAVPAVPPEPVAETVVVSTGPAGGNGDSLVRFFAASEDGSKVFFRTFESLVAADTDAQADVYERSGGQTTLVSTGPTGGNGDFSVQFGNAAGGTTGGASPDGSTVVFRTNEPLVAADTDDEVDLYQRSDGQTTLVSTGPTAGVVGPIADATLFLGASQDGSKVLFKTVDALVAADTDAEVDLYERSGGQTTLLSTGPDGGNGAFVPTFAGASPDGSTVVFSTPESLVAADTDAEADLYQRSGGQTTLVLTGSDGGNPPAAGFEGITQDGSTILFITSAALVAADTDTRVDIYQRSDGHTTLMSTGPDGGNGNFGTFSGNITPDGSKVFFHTDESLVVVDTDAEVDLYERSGGQTTLVSTGPDGGNGAIRADFLATSQDGSTVFFSSEESLVAADTDAEGDIYERSGGQTTLVSIGPDGGNGGFSALFEGASEDSSKVFFVTSESLVAADTDAQVDVYERSGGQTTLLSTGPDGGNGPADAVFGAASQDGSRVFFDTEESLVATDTDSVRDIYERRLVPPTCRGEEPTITGTNDADVLTGTQGRDVILGLGGNDTIQGHSGKDVICGGGGNDTIDGGSRNDTIDGGEGNDLLKGGSGGDDIFGADGNDELRGGSGADLLDGGSGDDLLDGGSGGDDLFGGPGDDQLLGGSGKDTLEQD